MGILRITVGVESLTLRGDVRELPNTMVDTGSEYTWVPRAMLEELGISVERVERFVTADGRIIARELGYAVVHAGGTRTADEVVFAEPGDMTLLGAHTIRRDESAGGPEDQAVDSGRARSCRIRGVGPTEDGTQRGCMMRIPETNAV